MSTLFGRSIVPDNGSAYHEPHADPRHCFAVIPLLDHQIGSVDEVRSQMRPELKVAPHWRPPNLHSSIERTGSLLRIGTHFGRAQPPEAADGERVFVQIAPALRR